MDIVRVSATGAGVNYFPEFIARELGFFADEGLEAKVEVLGNGVATWVLARGRRDDLNLEAVLRHSAVDALGSMAVVVSGAVILATGWQAIDPLASIAIAVLILA